MTEGLSSGAQKDKKKRPCTLLRLRLPRVARTFGSGKAS